MARKQVYYNMDDIESKNAIYNFIIGEKSNGKSYQVKLKRCLKRYLDTGRRFIIIRRWNEDIKFGWINQYFKDMDLQDMTKGKYNGVEKLRNTIIFVKYTIEEDGKITKKRGEKIGYIVPLSLEQHYSSIDFTDCDDIIYEEFMERRKLRSK